MMMARPKLLQDIEESIIASDEEEFTGTLPVDANTLEGHPVDYFASKTEVNQAISNYISTVLGTSY